MGISVIGSGYVGLVTGACFAEMGHTVTCVDVDVKKIELLKKGVLPIYEPDLDEMVEKNIREDRLRFTTSLADTVKGANVHFISVGTPSGEDGSADLQYVLDVAKELGKNMTEDYNVVADKSTVPVGTADKVTATIQSEIDKRDCGLGFDVVSNPDFEKIRSQLKNLLIFDGRNQYDPQQMKKIGAEYIAIGRGNHGQGGN